MLLDVLLVSGLYRRVAHIESGSWLSAAVSRTWIPATLVALLLAAAGFVVQKIVPQADSIGDIMALL